MPKRTTQILKNLLLLSIPAVIEHIMNTLLQYVDTAMVGRLGEQATAAVSTTTSVGWLVNCVPYGVATAALALIARANGAGRPDKTRRCAGQAGLLTIGSGLAMTLICLLLSPHIPVWMGAAPEIRAQASLYFFIISLPMVFRTASFAAASAIRAVRDTRTPMLINLGANLLNAGLNYWMIYVLGWGVTGAAIATAIAYTAGGAAMTGAAFSKVSLRFGRRDLLPDRKVLREYRRICLPALATNAAGCLGYVLFAGMVSGMGTTIFAAHSIAVTAEQLFYIPGYGLRTATASLIGNALGEEDMEKLKITEHLSIWITMAMMVVSGLVLYHASLPLMLLFTSSRPAAELGAAMLRLVAFTEPFYGLMVVLEGISYGKGRTRAVFYTETLSMYGVRILFTFLCVRVWGLDLQAVWTCMIADNICKALVLGVLYLKGRL